MRVYRTLPIFFVLSIIGYIYYSTLFVLIDGWLGLSTASGFANAALFTALAAAVVVSYGIAMFKDPGRVPASFSPNTEDPETPFHEIKKTGAELRYCQKCSQYKPPRTHHCHICERCVLKMDHHCIWINNCVGYRNYKIFLVSVFYGVVACIHSMVLLVGSAFASHKDQELATRSFNLSYVVVLVPLTIALCVLLGWHFYLMLQNKTSIEYHEGVRALWLAEQVGNAWRYPYNLGIYENLVSAFPFCYNMIRFLHFSLTTKGQQQICAAVLSRYWDRTSYVGSALSQRMKVLVSGFALYMIFRCLHFQLDNEIIQMQHDNSRDSGLTRISD